MTPSIKTLTAVAALSLSATVAQAQDAVPTPPDAVMAQPVEGGTAAAPDMAAPSAVAEQETLSELAADQSADQSQPEEFLQDAPTEAAGDTASEVSAADLNHAAEGESAAEMAEAQAPEAAVESNVAHAEAAEGDLSALEEEEHGEHGDSGGHATAHVTDVPFSFEGPFGTYDQFQLQRGLQVYTEVCSACHGMKFVALRTLSDSNGPGLPEDQMRAYAASLDIYDPELDEDRPRKPTDFFPTVTGDGMGPDLSLMAKARAGFHGPQGTGISQFFNGIGGPEYIYSVLTGYTGEESEQAGAVLYGNKAFAGGYIGMPAPLSDDLVEYQDGTPATLDQMSKDVSAFLMWAAEPKLMDRKQVGFVAVIFLIILASLLYLTNKRLWAPHKHRH